MSMVVEWSRKPRGQIFKKRSCAMNLLSRKTAALWLASMGVVLASGVPVRAQSFDFSSAAARYGSTPSYNFSGVGSYLSGTTTYVPFGGMGNFIPYSPGPGGGLGVQPGMRVSGGQMQTASMGGSMGMSPSLGVVRSQITPLAPISSGGMSGMRGGSGIGSMGGLIRRGPGGGAMGGMTRPPVGSYPFRQPPSLLGPATSAPSMSM
ncbi:MAG: hypothetical protein U0790_17620 [Isosphaeraceae bacterium]